MEELFAKMSVNFEVHLVRGYMYVNGSFKGITNNLYWLLHTFFLFPNFSSTSYDGNFFVHQKFHCNSHHKIVPLLLKEEIKETVKLSYSEVTEIN